MAVADSSFSPVALTSITSGAGCGSLEFRRAGRKTVLASAYAASPLRLLTPRNHGNASWVFSTSFGGGLVDGDRVDLRVAMEAETAALLATQASTKVYRSPSGCVQQLEARAGERAVLAIVPDPVVCFSGARYTQRVTVELADGASLVLFDAYTCGRAARGERWLFERLDSRTTVVRPGARTLVDATLLDRAHGSIAERMGRFGAMATLLVVGPRFEAMREAMRKTRAWGSPAEGAVAVASPVDADAVLLRVAADRFESASRILRPSFRALADVLGDDPFARKW